MLPCPGRYWLCQSLGTAGRWADLAIATWSSTWNYGPGWETPLLDAYGIPPDPGRTRYYRLLYDLAPEQSAPACAVSQGPVHDVQADPAVLRVIEGLRYRADDLEPE